MSQLFFDHLVVLAQVEGVINNISKTSEEKEELWGIVDEIVSHRAVISILDKLPRIYHEEFLQKFHDAPHHRGHIEYLNKKTGDNIETHIKKEMDLLEKELLQEIRELK